MIVKINNDGRIVIPKRYRDKFNLRSGSEANIIPLADNTGVSILRLVPRCSSCGSEENLTKTKDDFLCSECVNKLNSVLVKVD